MPDDNQQSVIAFLRRDTKGKMVMVVCNFNPVLREGYAMGVPNSGSYKEILNSDDPKYGGSGVTNGTVRSRKGAMHGFEQHVTLTLPPLSTLYFSVPAPRKKAVRTEKAKPAAKAAKKRPSKPKPQGAKPPSPNRLQRRKEIATTAKTKF